MAAVEIHLCLARGSARWLAFQAACCFRSSYDMLAEAWQVSEQTQMFSFLWGNVWCSTYPILTSTGLCICVFSCLYKKYSYLLPNSHCVQPFFQQLKSVRQESYQRTNLWTTICRQRWRAMSKQDIQRQYFRGE